MVIFSSSRAVRLIDDILCTKEASRSCRMKHTVSVELEIRELALHLRRIQPIFIVRKRRTSGTNMTAQLNTRRQRHQTTAFKRAHFPHSHSPSIHSLIDLIRGVPSSQLALAILPVVPWCAASHHLCVQVEAAGDNCIGTQGPPLLDRHVAVDALNRRYEIRPI